MSQSAPVMGHRIITSGRWLLLAAIVASAWLWGSTRPWTREIITWLLLAASVPFAAGLIFSQRWPRIPVPILLIVLLLAGYGWLMGWNSPLLSPDSVTLELVRFAPPFPSLPGFLHRERVIPELLLATAMLGALLQAADMTANPLWNKRLWITMALTGFSIVVLGLAQRLTQAPAIFWNLYENTGETFFGVFRYHANAGAFLNITLPLCACLALLSLRKNDRPLAAIFWITATLLTIGACCINASRAAIVVTAVILIIGSPSVILIGRSCQPSGQSGGRPLLILLITLLLGAVMALSFGIDLSVSRWKNNTIDLSESDRLLTYECILGYGLPRTGLLGSGPGTFEEAFAFTIKEDQLPVEGRWDAAHCDPLQALMEWGLPGSLCWSILMLGALLRGCLITIGKGSYENRIRTLCATLSLGGVLLHSLVDFPLQIASIQLLALLITGTLWGTRPERRNGRQEIEEQKSSQSNQAVKRRESSPGAI